MSLTQLRDRLRSARQDERVTRAEVESFLRSALNDGAVNFQEALILRAELEAHGDLFDADARELLTAFLEKHDPNRRS